MTDQQLLDLLHQGLHHVTRRTFPPLSSQDNIESLGVDSLELLELVSWAEEKTEQRVPDEEIHAIVSVGDLITLLSDAGAKETLE
ncbi:phosphopantetheine-binding protein [Streptomyces sp. NPDC127068]|uniref:phosphopantetheine-binding protein n=1 Tax=Streptomyces sp. NPDC127068 TaxID=3347127 RepID=UPI003660E215